MRETACYKIMSPNGSAFIIYQEQAPRHAPYEDEGFMESSLKFLSNLMKRRRKPASSVSQTLGTGS